MARLCLSQLKTDSNNTIHDVSDLEIHTVCSLWSGMGHIYRIKLPGAGDQDQNQQIIIKHVAAPRKTKSVGDQRKANSYQVEANFYENVAQQLIKLGLNIPMPLVVERDAGKSKSEIVIAMSYIAENGMGRSTDSDEHLKAVLRWLATLHASHWDISDHEAQELGLQRTASYWHLDTRLEEHMAMPNKGWEGRLKLAARAIDQRLKRDTQCIIHGDAKDANVLYQYSESEHSHDDHDVYMCDFQYCGRGAPSKDLAYFFCSSVAPDNETTALEYYLQQLTTRLQNDAMAPTLEELQESIDLAYCDYYRFMSGWGYWGSGGDGEERVKMVLNRLDGGKTLASADDYVNAVQREYG